MSRGLAVAAGAAAVLAIAASVSLRHDAPIASSPDGTIEVLSLSHGASVPADDAPSILGFRVGRNVRPVRLDAESLVVGLRRGARDVVVSGECGCVWPLRRLTSDPQTDWFVTPLHPRRSSHLTIRSSSGAEAVVATPQCGTPEPAAAEPLPVTFTSGTTRWVLTLGDDDRSVLVRRTGADGRGVRWALASATMTDGSGNSVARPSGPEALQHRLWLPLAAPGVAEPFHLCVHETSWTLDVRAEDGATAHFEFAPPR